MIRGALALGLVFCGGVLAAAPDPGLLDRSGDEVLRSAFIPSERNVHGEFRMLRRGRATCAQTLLYTPSLRRALQGIRRREARHWPEGRPGHADSIAYLEALDRAKARVLRSAPAEGRQTLAIEFVVAETAALFAIYELDGVERDGRFVVEALRSIEVREASPDYVRRAIEHMQRAAFGEEEEDDDDERHGETDR